MQDPEVLEEFKIEADEMLLESEEFLLEMEKGANFSENFNGVFRSFHSLKGAAGMFEIENLQTFMHTIETQFESLRNIGSASQPQIDYFLKAIDSARKILDGQEAHLDPDEFNQEPSSPAPSHTPNKAPSPAPLKAVVQERKGKKETFKNGLVYVVDDEEFICENLKDILTPFQYEVQTFTDPKKCLEALKNKAPDLLCTDLKMPGMTGIQLLEQVVKNKIHCPVVFITGFVDNELLTEGLSLGASGFLEKPFEEHQVVSLCKQTIEKNRAKKLLGRSISFMLYQFNDLDNYLKQQGKESLRISLKKELQTILKLRKESEV